MSRKLFNTDTCRNAFFFSLAVWDTLAILILVCTIISKFSGSIFLNRLRTFARWQLGWQQSTRQGKASMLPPSGSRDLWASRQLPTLWVPSYFLYLLLSTCLSFSFQIANYSSFDEVPRFCFQIFLQTSNIHSPQDLINSQLFILSTC